METLTKSPIEMPGTVGNNTNERNSTMLKAGVRRLGSLASCCLCTLLLSSLSHALPPTGTWEVVANGASLTLNIVSVDSLGHVTGNLVRSDGGVDSITGFWSESAKKLTFVRTINNPSVIQVFTGYLLNSGTTFCSTGEFNKMMAGSFEAFASTGANRDRTLFGWSARQCVA